MRSSSAIVGFVRGACRMLAAVGVAGFWMSPRPAIGEAGGDVAGEAEPAIYASVVRIENAVQVYDYRTPWHAGQFGGGNGSGFVIGPNRILTNAHVVSNSRRLIVRKHGDPGMVPARLLHIAHDSDLALLELEDPAPLDGVPFLELGDVPRIESEVRVIGYPIGGSRLSVTRGVVSRIDFSVYQHTGIDQHLVIQIDAAINPGNSGGPVLQGDRVVGVAFQALRQADNTGYVIPAPVVRRFLADIEDGQYHGCVDLALGTFPLLNPAHRAALGLGDDPHGVVVTRVYAGGSADGRLEPGDILLDIDGHPILADGRIRIDGQTVHMAEAVERKLKGETASVRYLRGGEEGVAELALAPFGPARIFAVQYETRPLYAVFGGLVFQPLSRNVIAAYGFDSLDIRKMVEDYLSEGLFREWEDVVVLTQVLADEVNAGVAGLRGLIVEQINGKPVRRMQDLADLLFRPMAAGELPEFVVIECRGAGRPIVLESARLADARQRIRARYGISQDHRLTHEAVEGSW